MWPWSKIQMYREHAAKWQDKFFALRTESEMARREVPKLKETISGLLADRDQFAKRVEELEEINKNLERLIGPPPMVNSGEKPEEHNDI